jgi:hypothetical protein
MLKFEYSNSCIEQFYQLCSATWDGNLICKSDRDMLVKAGYVTRAEGGWNIITPEGIKVLVNLGVLKS